MFMYQSRGECHTIDNGSGFFTIREKKDGSITLDVSCMISASSTGRTVVLSRDQLEEMIEGCKKALDLFPSYHMEVNKTMDIVTIRKGNGFDVATFPISERELADQVIALLRGGVL